MLNLRPLLASWVKEMVETIPRDCRSDYSLVKESIVDVCNLQRGTIVHRFTTLSRDRGMSNAVVFDWHEDVEVD